jgi:NADH-quinone oxidoreductase subunit M
MAELPWLSFIIFSPLIGVAAILFIPKEKLNTIRIIALIMSIAVFSLSLYVYFNFNGSNWQMQFEEKKAWIEQFGISYHLGIDGISILLVMLTTFLTMLSVLASWCGITERVKEYMICMLLLETGMLGVFTALNLFLFYIFWEAMLIPMYLLIIIWGGPRRIYAGIKFFLYTTAGSVMMLVAILALYFISGKNTLELFQLMNISLTNQQQFWLFLAFFIAFAIKVPLFPLHTWLPDAHVEAPTAGSVILAGVLLKMGTYGMLRFCWPLFPDTSHQFIPLISILAIIGIIYGALVAMAQKDVKKLVAYSSVSHLGFVVLGIFAFNVISVQGSILQMINHGLSTGALFLIVGMLYERRHTRFISDYGGLSSQVPALATFFLIVCLSSLGLPGLNGFVGEFLILLGTFYANSWYAIVAAGGVILAAVYLLWMYQRVMFGPLDKPENKKLKDLSFREYVVLIPILFFIVMIGVYPQPFLNKTEATVQHLITQINERRAENNYSSQLNKIHAEELKEKLNDNTKKMAEVK